MAEIVGVSGNRLYVKTERGETAADQLRSVGAHWDARSGLWWVASYRRPEVEEIVRRCAVRPAEEKEATRDVPPEDPYQVQLVGKALYRGRTYYVRYVGETRRGYAARLTTLDQKVDFWAKCARPGEGGHDGSGDVAVVFKHFEARLVRGRRMYQTIGGILDFIRRQSDPSTRVGRCNECGASGPAGSVCGECHEGMHAAREA